jgi:aerobic carbon-monoxide dehydrogenase large subunit
MATTEQTPPVIGQPLVRKEDPELITGGSRYVDDITVPGMLWVHVVRSPFAHAKINSVDVSKALAMEGCVAAFSGADLAEEWAAPLVCAWPVTDDIKMSEHWPLTKDKARYAGDGVAVVVAESRALAKDAAELVEVDYEPLPAVTDPVAAMADGAPLVHDDFGTNVSSVWGFEKGDSPAPYQPAAPFFDDPDLVKIKERYRLHRLIPNAMEPRGVIVEPNTSMGEFTMWTASQIPHVVRTAQAITCGIPEAKLRVVAPDVGGGFGSKLDTYAEESICLVLARRLSRPMKWVEERSEGYLATIHGRDIYTDIEMAATRDGVLKAVRVKVVAAMGAYYQIVSPGIQMLSAWLYGGLYDIEGYEFEYTNVFTHNTPTDAYRGAGRPEATYAVERTMDALARTLDMDPAELRRKNYIPLEKFPNFTIASGLTVDSGDYVLTHDAMIDAVGYAAFRSEQQQRRQSRDRKQIGIGLSTWTEMCGLAPSRVLHALKYIAGGWDAATIEMLPTGTVRCLIGVTPHGQGHVTTFSQIVAEQLGVDFEDVEVLHGDTQVVPLGMDTYGSRSLSVGGVAVHFAGEKIIAKARTLAAHQLECAEDDLEFAGGNFTVKGTDRSANIKALAFAAWTAHDLPDGMEPGLTATHLYDPPNFSWPNGAHACVVEVDTETGSVDILRYVAVDDCGVVINPLVVEGQVHGGVAQGIAEALFEEAAYDEEGNLLHGTMTTYMVPGAPELPNLEHHHTCTPSPTNPLGVKGIGEAGTIASPPAVINAVVDALSHLGVRDVERPATPERVWKAIQEASR